MDGNGNSTFYRYKLGCLTTVAQGPTTTNIDNDGACNATTITSQANVARRIDITRGPHGLPTTIKRPGGLETTLAYDYLGKVTRSTDTYLNAEGVRHSDVQTWDYDAFGNVSRYTNAAGEQWISNYDANRRLASTSGPRGAISASNWNWTDASHASVIDAAGSERQLTYDAEGHLRGFSVAGHGEVLRVEYNGLGLIKTRTSLPASDAWRFAYDPDGHLLTARSPEGRENSIAYDFADRITSKSVGLAGAPLSTWLYGYDYAGNMVSSTNPLGGHTRYAYDALNRMVSRQRDGQAAETFSYDAAQTFIEHYDGASPSPWRTDLDVDGRVVKITDPAGFITQLDRDPRGFIAHERRYHVDSPQDTYERWLTHDSVGRLVLEREGSMPPTTYSYAEGALKMLGMPSGRYLSYGYDGPDDVPTSVTDSAGTTTKTTRDALGRTLAVIQRPGTPFERRTSFSYDDVGRTTAVVGYGTTAPGSGSGLVGPVVLTRSPDGLLSSRRLPDGAEYGFAYDASANLTGVWTPSDSYAYAYNGLNQYLGMTDSGGFVGRSADYNAFGELWHEYDGAAVAATRSYDSLAGRLESVTPACGAAERYEYYSNGWLSSVSVDGAGTKSRKYDKGGLVSEADWLGADGRSSAIAYGRDSVGRVVFETTSDGKYHEAEYDPDGPISRIDGVRYMREAGDHRITRIDVGEMLSPRTPISLKPS
jgi:YD repeat-containing protein